jgi:chromosome segregation ATPase
MIGVSSAQEDELNLEKIRLEEPRGPSGPVQAVPEAPETGPEDVISALARTLAQALGSAIEQIERYDRQESGAVQDSVRAQSERLNATVEGLIDLTKKIEQLTDAISQQKATNCEVQRQIDRLSTAVASIQEGEARLEDQLKTVRVEMGHASTRISDRVDALALRVELQDQGLSELKLTLSEGSPRVVALVERMDRHANAIRAIRETQGQRAGSLHELADVLERLRSSAAAPTDSQELNTL